MLNLEEEGQLLTHKMSSLSLDWKHFAGHKQGESFVEMSLNFPVTSLIFA